MNDDTPPSERTPQPPWWLIGVGGILLGALAIGVVAWLLWPESDPEAPTRTIEVGVHRPMEDQTASYQKGDTCVLSPDSERHIVISDADGSTVGTIRPETGTLRQGDNQAWYCSAYENVTAPDSAFYSFAVDDQPVRVVSRVELDADNWSIALGLVDNSDVPVATPNSLPIRR